MADDKKIKIEDHPRSQWPYWLFVPVESVMGKGQYTHLTWGWESIKRRQELTEKKIVFQFNRLWKDAPGIFGGRRRVEIWHRYKFKNKGDRLIFLMTNTGENV
jgi:hypothetical protein